jgi:hypothetical protein
MKEQTYALHRRNGLAYGLDDSGKCNFRRSSSRTLATTDLPRYLSVSSEPEWIVLLLLRTCKPDLSILEQLELTEHETDLLSPLLSLSSLHNTTNL